MKTYFVLLLYFLCPLVAAGQSVKLPAEVPGDSPLVLITPLEADAEALSWIVLDAGPILFPPGLLASQEVAVILPGKSAPGRYRVACLAAKVVDGKARLSPFTVCTVVIGGAPVPPQPPPMPPVPPAPPDPPPPPPMPPADPLAGLAAVYASEPDPAKAQHVVKLTAIYRAGVGFCALPTMMTWQQPLDAMRAEGERVGFIRGSIPATQRVVVAFLLTKFPANLNTPLNAEGRRAQALAFEQAAQALEGLPR